MAKKTNKDLQSSFRMLNKRFFAGQLKLDPNRVRFGSDGDCEGNDALTIHGEAGVDAIFIHEDFRDHYDVAVICLIHEMAHVCVTESGHIGYEEDGGHGPWWQAEVIRLLKLGAYDGLL